MCSRVRYPKHGNTYGWSIALAHQLPARFSHESLGGFNSLVEEPDAAHDGQLDDTHVPKSNGKGGRSHI